MTTLLLTLPWLAVLGFLRFVVRVPRELPAAGSGAVAARLAGVGDAPDRFAAAPFVSVIVPARNEAHNIEACIRSLTASRYPSFEVIVVDDQSEDGTGDLARAAAPANASRIEVVDGADLPEGWLGKPWACVQGARMAAGDLLLFTDADTVHAPDLLGRAVAGLREERADLLSVMGRQVMESFWERAVQPQIFLVMLFRYPDFETTVRRGHWRDAIANGQYMLFTRAAYDGIGGHGAVHDQVVEDLAIAQHLKREGLRLRIRSADEDLATRMYRSLRELIEGWSKNLLIGGLQSLPPEARRVAVPMALLSGVGLWVVPPVVLAAALVGVGGAGMLAWSAATVGVSVLVWALFSHHMGAPARYGLVYPLGAAVATYIFVRSWRRGLDVEWKGRRYRVQAVEDRV